ncbi:2'-5' RNA ligase family protein [Legionella dresdenensis]|uniref:2'-5' RNA ligase family protein n=1 Tax=Legionella dresdenensis TaxID=450200 RepID=A0ABV8CHX1_9GAMM
MGNRITHHSKLISHFLLVSVIALMMMLNGACFAQTLPINVYLKLSPHNRISEQITQFGRKLEQTYGDAITPYINRYPVHITLYLTRYDARNLTKIIARVKNLAGQQPRFTITTTGIELNSHLYASLAVKKNPVLQHLSNRIVMSLSQLRDHKTQLPSWTRGNPEKTASFSRYGSPNTFDCFEPHISLFDGNRADKAMFQKLTAFIAQYNMQNESVQVTGIGVGIVNREGQIVKELLSVELGKN